MGRRLWSFDVEFEFTKVTAPSSKQAYQTFYCDKKQMSLCAFGAGPCVNTTTEFDTKRAFRVPLRIHAEVIFTVLIQSHSNCGKLRATSCCTPTRILRLDCPFAFHWPEYRKQRQVSCVINCGFKCDQFDGAPPIRYPMLATPAVTATTDG